MSGVPIGNVQRPTPNSQLSTGWPKGRMAGGIWGQTRNLHDWTFGPVDMTERLPDRRGGVGFLAAHRPADE